MANQLWVKKHTDTNMDANNDTNTDTNADTNTDDTKNTCCHYHLNQAINWVSAAMANKLWVKIIH